MLSLSKALSRKDISIYHCRRNLTACLMYRTQYLFTDQNDRSPALTVIRYNAGIYVDHLYYYSLFHKIQKDRRGIERKEQSKKGIKAVSEERLLLGKGAVTRQKCQVTVELYYLIERTHVSSEKHFS